MRQRSYIVPRRRIDDSGGQGLLSLRAYVDVTNGTYILLRSLVISRFVSHLGFLRKP